MGSVFTSLVTGFITFNIYLMSIYQNYGLASILIFVGMPKQDL
jgi:hypothetical protein